MHIRSRELEFHEDSHNVKWDTDVKRCVSEYRVTIIVRSTKENKRGIK